MLAVETLVSRSYVVQGGRPQMIPASRAARSCRGLTLPSPWPSHHFRPSDHTSSSSLSHSETFLRSASSSGISAPTSSCAECNYFAYGSNLHKDSLAGLDIKIKSRLPATVLDPKVHLVFRHRGGGGTLLRESEGDPPPMFFPPDGKVHGVLYRMATSDLRKLGRDNTGYELTRIEVQVYGDDLRGSAIPPSSGPTGQITDGDIICPPGCSTVAWVYTSNAMARLPSEVVPTEAYMMRLREGAADQFLDPSYQAWLSSIKTVSSAGLPAEYWDSPADKLLGAASAFLIVGLIGLVILVFLTWHSSDNL